jgi:hypothetical protein
MKSAPGRALFNQEHHMIRTAVVAARTFVLAALLICASSFGGEASAAPKHRHHHAVATRVTLAHPDCNVKFPCEGVISSPRGEMIARKVGIGGAQKIYKPRSAAPARIHVATLATAGLVSHPDGCPARAFCGCGAVKRLETTWGIIVAKPREMWLAAAWFKFPRAAPAAGMVAVRRHHVFVLEAHLDGATWLAYDANSGRHATRIHARSIAGYAIVDPRGGA